MIDKWYKWVFIIVVLFVELNCWSEYKEKVYVVALEKEKTTDTGELWDPYIYAIDLESMTINQKMKLSEGGSPYLCYLSNSNEITIILYHGVFSNGTKVGNEYSTIITFNPVNFEIIQSVTKKELYDVKLNLSEEDEFFQIRSIHNLSVFPFARSNKRREIFCYYVKDKQPFLQIRDLCSLAVKKEIKISFSSLPMGQDDLGEFRCGYLVVNEQRIVMLFSGNSVVGTYSPSYLVSYNINNDTFEHVCIGGNPANGLIIK